MQQLGVLAFVIFALAFAQVNSKSLCVTKIFCPEEDESPDSNDDWESSESNKLDHFINCECCCRATDTCDFSCDACPVDQCSATILGKM